MPSAPLFELSVVVGAALLSACVAKSAQDLSPTASATQPSRVASSSEKPTAGASVDAAEVRATRSGALTLESAVRQAVAWHSSVTESIGRLNEQGEAVNEARSGYLPKFDWGIDSSFDSENRYRPMATLSGSQMLYDFGKVRGRVQVAEAGVAGRRSQILAAVDNLSRDTAYAYLEIRRGSALKQIAQEKIGDTKEILELVRSRTDLGASTQSDRLQAEARVEAAEATLFEVDAQLGRWQASLASLTGTGGGVDSRTGLPDWLGRACTGGEPDWSRVPAVMEAEAEQNAARAQIDLSRAEGLPTVSLDGRIGHDVTELDAGDPEYNAGVNVRGSLYNGGETGARRRAAAYALGASQAAATRARVDIQAKLNEATSQISSLRQLRKSLTERETMMSETRKLYEMQYVQLGTRTLLDLLNATEEYHAARFDQKNVEYDLYKLGIDCTYMSGKMRDEFDLVGQRVQGIAL